MTTARENETLTRVGPGTPMGALMRRYWLPALKSSELEADGAPVRLMLLGEKLIGFRDSAGRVGIMDHRCPHRCASLFFGRNEESGIRCVYHGWKFDVDGACLEMPNVPPHQDFRRKVRAKAYKTAERNGLVWVYMGEAAEAPPLPAIEAALLPESTCNAWFVLRECSWLQGLEGDLDSTHLGFLHYGAVSGDDFARSQTQRFTAASRAPTFVARETDWGLMYAALRSRDDEPDRVNMRITQLVLPCWTMPPINPLADNHIASAWVPVDDTHHMLVILARKDIDSVTASRIAGRVVGSRAGFDYQPNTTDWLGRWRLVQSRANDYRIDRAVQRTKSFTGIEGITLQDHAMVESMGGISDRTREHLTPADLAITRARRLLLRAVQRLEREGTPPPSALSPEICAGARGGHVMAAKGADWLRVYAETLAAEPFRRAAVAAAE